MGAVGSGVVGERGCNYWFKNGVSVCPKLSVNCCLENIDLAGVYVAFEYCECCSHLRSRRASLLARLKVTVDDILARKLSLAMSAAIWA